MKENSKIVLEGLTFDDVLLIPAYSEVLPSQVNLQTAFSRNILLNTPIVTAAMDTVTDSKMAIAIAREGGIGVIHKNMSIENQAWHVKQVKRAENAMILDPVTIDISGTVGDVWRIMEKYNIGGIPVVDKHNILLGIVTSRDMRFQTDMKKPVTEIMTANNIIKTDQSIDLDHAKDIFMKHRIEKLPVVDKNNKLVGLITYKDITKATDCPLSCKDEHGRLRVAAAVGISGDSLQRMEAIVNAGVDALVIDTAHAHTKNVNTILKEVKKRYKDVDIVVGNIATPEAAKLLVENGADAVKVGIGPGSICTTRVVAGVGVPQLSAIMNVADALKGTGVPVIADGGIRYSGDIVKAIAAGANSIMAGGLFAGSEEAPGETIIFNGRKFKSYRGMGSVEAMQLGSKDRYFQDMEDDIKKLVPEGISGRVPFKGNINEIVYQLIGGLKAGMGYCGAKNIEDLHNKSRFVRITSNGVTENHPHDVTITREAPNYSRMD
ncbi:MAG: IMP dehydrogenase [Bacteroidales bacterium]|nr:IMP dehydrogenase [Bacteroidales bacterium]MDD4217233.1 IMP dehydrogenase [Bacteroidales bacterium]MDY0141064.1 IMP dehydrogenase [Bacteroidales bacterium]